MQYEHLEFLVQYLEGCICVQTWFSKLGLLTATYKVEIFSFSFLFVMETQCKEEIWVSAFLCFMHVQLHISHALKQYCIVILELKDCFSLMPRNCCYLPECPVWPNKSDAVRCIKRGTLKGAELRNAALQFYFIRRFRTILQCKALKQNMHRTF